MRACSLLLLLAPSRPPAPASLPICNTQAPKPSPGPHKQRECLPLILVLRNRLKFVRGLVCAARASPDRARALAAEAALALEEGAAAAAARVITSVATLYLDQSALSGRQRSLA